MQKDVTVGCLLGETCTPPQLNEAIDRSKMESQSATMCWVADTLSIELFFESLLSRLHFCSAPSTQKPICKAHICCLNETCGLQNHVPFSTSSLISPFHSWLFLKVFCKKKLSHIMASGWELHFLALPGHGAWWTTLFRSTWWNLQADRWITWDFSTLWISWFSTHSITTCWRMPILFGNATTFLGHTKNHLWALDEATGGKGSKCHVFMCCGKACCSGCGQTVKDRNFGTALENFYPRESEDIARNFLCNELNDHADKGEGFITTVPVL